MLDTLDKNILHQLEIDSRQSNATIARKLKSNKTVINYRINRLENKKIITGYTFISNQTILGKLSYGVLIKFRDILVDEEEKIIEKLKKLNSISWVSSVNGNWDVILVIVEKDIQSFNQALQKVFELCGHNIKEYVFYSDYEGIIKNHQYLYPTKVECTVSYFSKNLITLNNSELEVYNALKKNPKISLLKIAQDTNKTYDTIKSKFVHLKKEGVLLRCSPIINIESLGYQEFLCLFNLSPSSERIHALSKYLMQQPSVIRYSWCLGHFNLIINIHTENSQNMKEVMYKLRNKFGDIINNYEILQTTKKLI